MKVYLAGKIDGSMWRSALYGPTQPEPWNWFDQWPRDKARDRAMVAEGWTMLRFSGSEVHRGAAGCVKQVMEIAADR